MNNFVKIFSAAGLLATLQATALAGYSCKIYDKPENAPGGDVPVATFYTDSDSYDEVLAACRGKVQRPVIDYWLQWVEDSKLPQDWRKSDLFDGQPVPQTPPTSPAPQPPSVSPTPAQPVNNSGYACLLFDKPESAPNGNVPYVTFYTDKRDVEPVKQKCIDTMTAFGVHGVFDYQVIWVEQLPRDWNSADLYTARP